MKKIFFSTAVVFLLLACSKEKSISDLNSSDKVSAAASKTGSNSPSEQNVVHILSSGFSPDSMMVNIDNTVTWVNDDTKTHTVSSDKFDSGDIPPGGSFKFHFDNTGTYEYFCRYHGERAVLVVAGIR